jgi:hypothetical protein
MFTIYALYSSKPIKSKNFSPQNAWMFHAEEIPLSSVKKFSQNDSFKHSIPIFLRIWTQTAWVWFHFSYTPHALASACFPDSNEVFIENTFKKKHHHQKICWRIAAFPPFKVEFRMSEPTLTSFAMKGIFAEQIMMLLINFVFMSSS